MHKTKQRQGQSPQHRHNIIVKFTATACNHAHNKRYGTSLHSMSSPSLLNHSRPLPHPRNNAFPHSKPEIHRAVPLQTFKGGRRPTEAHLLTVLFHVHTPTRERAHMPCHIRTHHTVASSAQCSIPTTPHPASKGGVTIGIGFIGGSHHGHQDCTRWPMCGPHVSRGPAGHSSAIQWAACRATASSLPGMAYIRPGQKAKTRQNVMCIAVLNPDA
jgi:hypothetical protein